MCAEFLKHRAKSQKYLPCGLQLMAFRLSEEKYTNGTHTVCTVSTLKTGRPGAIAWWPKSSMCQDPIWALVCVPSAPTSHPARCLWPGKAVEDGPRPWDPVPMWETPKKLLDLDWLSSGRHGHLGSEPLDGRSSLCRSFQRSRVISCT